MKYHDALVSALSVSAAVLLSASPLWSQTNPLQSEGGPQGKQSYGSPGSQPADKDQSGMQTMPKAGAKESSHAGMAKEDIKKAQEALKEKGHDPGPADGVIGPKTQAALKEFQQSQGLKATGTLDEQTKQALGLGGASRQEKGNVSGEEKSSLPAEKTTPGNQPGPGTKASPATPQSPGQ